MTIERTGFGWIVIDGKRYESDILITTEGEIRNRYQEFPEAISHSVGRNETERLLLGNPEVIIFGTGQGGILSLPKEIKDYLKENGVEFICQTTPEAIKTFNQERRRKSALFHLTC